MAGMQAKLMGSAGERLECHQGLSVTRRKYLPSGNPFLAQHRIIDLARPVLRIKTKAQPNDTSLTGNTPFKKGMIFFRYQALGKLT